MRRALELVRGAKGRYSCRGYGIIGSLTGIEQEFAAIIEHMGGSEGGSEDIWRSMTKSSLADQPRDPPHLTATP